MFVATCVVRSKLEETQGFVTDEVANDAVADHVYKNALPLLRGMIESGRVRVTFPNHEKVHTCLKFSFQQTREAAQHSHSFFLRSTT